MSLLSIARRLFLVLALSTGVTLAAQPSAASAEPIRSLRMAGYATCDSATHEWVVTWHITNMFDQGATLGNFRANPADHPVVALPGEIGPGQEITGEQRFPANVHSGNINIDANWHDGPVTLDHYWPVYIKTTCPRAV